MKIGLSRVDITPKRQVSLAGYFNNRISQGVLDRLYARVILLEKGPTVLAIVTLDLICLPAEEVGKIKKRLYRTFGILPAHILISCTHTHTGPATSSLFAIRKDTRYLKGLITIIEKAFGKACRTKRPGELFVAQIREKGLSANRRFIMKNGKVITNPAKGDQNVLKPEGPVDNLITTIVFTSKERITGLLVKATNHVDTMGGDRISADWPGHLERELNRKLKGKFPVLVLTGTAGNINHFDRKIFRSQSSYQESRRIGREYSRYVLKSLKNKKQLKISELSCLSREMEIPYRKINQHKIKKARELLKTPFIMPDRDLTAEDLAQGSIVVKKVFSQELLNFMALRKRKEKVIITVFRIGSLAIVGIPGEPFVEIGLAIKQTRYFPCLVVTGNTNGSAGYIPLKRHFKKGGYETYPNPYNRFSENLGEKIIKEAVRMLRQLSGRK